MKIKVIINKIGQMLILEAVCFILPIIVSFIYKDNMFIYFIIIAILTYILGYFMSKLNANNNSNINLSESFAIVGVGWLVLSFIACLPFFISGQIPNLIDALFETVSGFTTTGATILSDVERISKSMLFWRSFTHFVGGMGVLVLMLVFLSSQGEHVLIMKAESPGPIVSKILPHVSDTAKVLYGIYILLTIITIASYFLSGMPLFDSICIGLGTAGTGGFSVRNSGCSEYSFLSQNLISIFMILFGVNFNVYFLIITRNFKNAFKSEELRVYISIILIAIFLTTINTLSIYKNASVSFHYALFQISSVMTTTGYAITDTNNIPIFSKMILLILMFVGGCSGSTAGGLKISRVVLYFKMCVRECYLQLHPNAIKIVKFENKKISNNILRVTSNYFIIYVIILFLGILLISINNFDFETTVSSVIETYNNIGVGFSKVGPKGNFYSFSYFSKIVFILLMLIGRLEIFPMILIFTKNIWKKFD